MKIVKAKYAALLNNIGLSIEQARQNAYRVVNAELVKTNWKIGRHIVEYEQQGKERAEYGTELLTRLSKDLRLRYGKGFGRQNLLDMRRFYIACSNLSALKYFDKLSMTKPDNLIAIYQPVSLVTLSLSKCVEGDLISSLFLVLGIKK